MKAAKFTDSRVDGEGAKSPSDIPEGASDISNEFDHVVFADIHDMEKAGGFV